MPDLAKKEEPDRDANNHYGQSCNQQGREDLVRQCYDHCVHDPIEQAHSGSLETELMSAMGRKQTLAASQILLSYTARLSAQAK